MGKKQQQTQNINIAVIIYKKLLFNFKKPSLKDLVALGGNKAYCKEMNDHGTALSSHVKCPLMKCVWHSEDTPVFCGVPLDLTSVLNPPWCQKSTQQPVQIHVLPSGDDTPALPEIVGLENQNTTDFILSGFTQSTQEKGKHEIKTYWFLISCRGGRFLLNATHGEPLILATSCKTKSRRI